MLITANVTLDVLLLWVYSHIRIILIPFHFFYFFVLSCMHLRDELMITLRQSRSV
jgi:hypothetical protein